MKKTLSLVLAILLCLAVFSGCSNSDKAAKTTTITSEDETFSVEVPKGWSDASGKLNENASLETAYAKHECYFMAIMDKKGNFTDGMKGFKKIVEKQTANLYSLDSLGDATEIEVDGNKAYLYRFDISQNGINATMWWITCETENYYGQLATWTLKENVDEYEQELLSVAKSFKEIPQSSKEAK